MPAKIILDVDNLGVHLHQKKERLTLVRQASFQIENQKTLALVGESGSGKTTTALAIVQLLSAKRGYAIEGSVWFEGENLVSLSQKKLREIRGKKISMIFQDPATALNPVFSIGAQIAEMFTLHGQDEGREKTYDMLDKVGLADDRDYFETYPHQLSGGMKQRVMIAMALSLNPKLVIADEPTTALDLTVQAEILALLKTMKTKSEMTLLIITHDMGVVAEMADQVAVMYASEIVECGTCKEIFLQAAHPYTKALLTARPSKANRKSILPTIADSTFLISRAKAPSQKIYLSPTHWMLYATTS
jgi:peptide/nickel transport system ATP-binding protein